MEKISVHLIIEGRVQGVWYRGWTVQKATELGLSGWVRNRGDGSVEISVGGPKAKIKALISACYEGPPLAQVSHIQCDKVAEVYEMSGFKQRSSI